MSTCLAILHTSESNFCHLDRVNPFSDGRHNNFERVNPSERYQLTLNRTTGLQTPGLSVFSHVSVRVQNVNYNMYLITNKLISSSYRLV